MAEIIKGKCTVSFGGVTLHTQDPHLLKLWNAKEPDALDEIQREAHESTLDAIFQFDLMTKLGYKLNFLTGDYE